MIWNIITVQRLTITVFIVNLIITAFTAYIFLLSPDEYSPGSKSALIKTRLGSLNGTLTGDHHRINGSSDEYSIPPATEPVIQTVEIWSKAAIGHYLWQHVLGLKITKNHDGISLYGYKRINQNVKLKFRSGPNLNHDSLEYYASQNVEIPKNLVLVLNGRDEMKVDYAKSWLDFIESLSLEYKLNVGVVMLGNETCHNEWIKPYLKSSGGPVSFVFVVYDWSQVDDIEIFQWPLGVATYRNFPLINLNEHDIHSERPYVCNFLGTLYENSSRVEVAHVIQEVNKRYTPAPCLLKGRIEWEPHETRESLQTYLDALKSSDITLSPVGMNHECYRIFEALSFGSLPVLEEDPTLVEYPKSNCDQNSAYRLLKKHNAPVIYVKNWRQQLPQLIQNELNMSHEDKIIRRQSLLKWYENFKKDMRDQFLHVVMSKFQLN